MNPAAQLGGAAAELPAAHDGHAPEHAALVRPALTPNVPAGHSVHAMEPKSEYVPGEQGEHTPPVPAKPAGQNLPVAVAEELAVELAVADDVAVALDVTELCGEPVGLEEVEIVAVGLVVPVLVAELVDEAVAVGLADEEAVGLIVAVLFGKHCGSTPPAQAQLPLAMLRFSDTVEPRKPAAQLKTYAEVPATGEDGLVTVFAYAASLGCESATNSSAASARAYTRSSPKEPAKSEPALAERSPLHPTRSDEAARAGSVTVVARAKTSAPSRKALSW